MEELTFEEIFDYHREIILASNLQEDRGLGGQLLNTGNLDFTVTFSNNFSDPFERAAFVLHGLATGHAFVQGNKRIAFLLAALILLRTTERYNIVSSDEENNRFVREVTTGSKTREEIRIWLHSVAKKGR
ncbi:MAG: Fic family protein [Acidobacteriota bacterium]|nr:Fic family protein [Acidobacteriota bacterium]